MIVEMRHLDLICTAAGRESTLLSLRELGAVHLDLSAASGEAVSLAKGEGADAESAVRLILKARGKTPKDEFSVHAKSVADVLALDEDRSTLISEKERLEREIAVYLPYGDFDPALVVKLREKGVDLSSVAELPAKLPEMRLGRMQEKLARVENRIRIDDAKIACADEAAILSKFPEIRDRIAFAAAKELLAADGSVAMVSGWLPARQESVFAEAAKTNGWGYLLREPTADETPPTLLEPPKWFRPVKSLFEGLGIAPGYTEADASVPFMCYFSLFFAMLVGDGGYGALFLALTLAMRKKLPRAWLVMLIVFNSATILWGLLSNTWFGAGIPWCADWATVKWLADPSYNNMMLLCFTIGVSHLILARLWNAALRINSLECLPEFGWAGVLFFMYLVTNAVVGVFSGIPTWSYWVLGSSIVLIVSKTRGAALGMMPLNVMSSLGDIISYVRLFAVGLASVKVAENFNSMATGLVSGDDAWWLKALMSLAMVAILVVGHALNLAMAGLSILVHAVRLNTLEFSNHKGISWSGYAFRPFKKNN